MYAIANQGNVKFYTSLVFAHYEDKQEKQGTNWWGQYFIVLNEDKTALVKHYSFVIIQQYAPRMASPALPANASRKAVIMFVPCFLVVRVSAGLLHADSRHIDEGRGVGGTLGDIGSGIFPLLMVTGTPCCKKLVYFKESEVWRMKALVIGTRGGERSAGHDGVYGLFEDRVAGTPRHRNGQNL